MDFNTIKKALLFHGFKYIKIELEAQVYLNCDCGYGHNDDDDGCSCHASAVEAVENNINFPASIAQRIKYQRFYDDGSVNTELTLTYPTKYAEDLPTIAKCFVNACKDVGEIETQNAGLHITLLEGYKYPRSKQLPYKKTFNFLRNVNKLMFGLAFLATEGNKTRGFNFRDLQASYEDKYSAIYTHGDTCLEFRIFDTCYGDTMQIKNYLATIVKTLRYYTEDNRKTPAIKASLSKYRQSNFISKHSRGAYRQLSEVFNTATGRQRLVKELMHLTDKESQELLQNIQADKKLLFNDKFFAFLKGAINN